MNEELLDQVKIVTRDQIKYDIDNVKPIESLSPYINVEELPSKFLPYPKGSKISYKTFSYGELEQWANTSLADEDKIKLALSGIKTEGFEITDLDLQDFYYIMMLRKLSTFNSPRFKLSFECPHCANYTTVTPELSEIEFSELELIDEIPVLVEMSDKKILEFKPMTISDFLRFKKSNLEDTKLNRLALQVRNMEFEKALEYITNSTSIDDMEILDELDVLLNFGNQKITVSCSDCGNPVIVPIAGVSALAEPFRKQVRSLKDSIISRKK
jgi:hypothetical protein|nr:MAG TPA: baseplate protein [Caudoviricetes sp.]